MSNINLTILDGTHLRNPDRTFSYSESLTVSKLLELTESIASSSMFGVSLPEALKSKALKRVQFNPDHEISELDGDKATIFAREYVSAIADELKDDPLVISILDGSNLKMFLEDEDDFAMLAESLFIDLDTEDTGKLRKNEIRNALLQMGVELGIPPFSDFPQLNDILKKHGAEHEEEVGQAQFAEVLQLVLQELADLLTKKHVVVIQNLKIMNGSKLRKLLADEKKLDEITEKILEQNQTMNNGQKCAELIRTFLEKEGEDLGLPLVEADKAVELYDSVFADAGRNSAEVENADTGSLLKEILEKFAVQLDANPVFHDLDNL